MSPSLIYSDPMAEVWLGDSSDPEQVAAILDGRRPDALIVDAPYSERTHAGHAGGKVTADRAARFGDGAKAGVKRYAARLASGKTRPRRDINYACWSAADVERFCDLWCPLVSGWCVSLTDHILAPHWDSSLGLSGRLVFAWLPFVEVGSRVRMSGDGPALWACQLVVARPRSAEWAKWGALPGAYVVNRSASHSVEAGRVVGGKPLSGMLAIVRDYSRRGHLVVDPCCGGGTTLVAAKTLGRRSIGIDRDRSHAEIAARRLAEAREQLPLVPESEPMAEQEELFR